MNKCYHTTVTIHANRCALNTKHGLSVVNMDSHFLSIYLNAKIQTAVSKKQVRTVNLELAVDWSWQLFDVCFRNQRSMLYISITILHLMRFFVNVRILASGVLEQCEGIEQAVVLFQRSQ